MSDDNHRSCKRLRKSKTCKERQIKVCRIFSDYMPKNHSPYAPTPSVPWIQLKGKWLEQAGFAIDTPIKVKVMEGCLVLTAQENPEQNA